MTGSYNLSTLTFDDKKVSIHFLKNKQIYKSPCSYRFTSRIGIKNKIRKKSYRFCHNKKGKMSWIPS